MAKYPRVSTFELVAIGVAILALLAIMFPLFLESQKFGLITKERCRVLGGRWVWSDTTVTQTDLDELQPIMLFHPEYDSVQLTFQACIQDAHYNYYEGARVVFGYKSLQDFYVWNAGGYGNTRVEVEAWSQLKSRFNFKPLLPKQQNFTLPVRQWKDIRFVIRRDERTMEGYVNGEKITFFVMDKPVFGKLGLATFHTSVAYKDIRVSPADE